MLDESNASVKGQNSNLRSNKIVINPIQAGRKTGADCKVHKGEEFKF